jgi:translation initiation factor IF-1
VGQLGHGGHDGHGAHQAGSQLLASLLSPRVLFSVLVGVGATGLLLRPLIGATLLLFVAALAGGVAFEALLVRPLWNFLFRFASQPALTLESALMDEARAASGFDRAGHGLVLVELGGEVVQVLGTLRDEDRALGVRVRAGDRVRIEDVDATRNRCTVAYVGPG